MALGSRKTRKLPTIRYLTQDNHLPSHPRWWNSFLPNVSHQMWYSNTLDIWSDHGTNFVGANPVLKELYAFICSTKWKKPSLTFAQLKASHGISFLSEPRTLEGYGRQLWRVSRHTLREWSGIPNLTSRRWPPFSSSETFLAKMEKRIDCCASKIFEVEASKRQFPGWLSSKKTITQKWSYEAFHSIPRVLVYWPEWHRITAAWESLKSVGMLSNTHGSLQLHFLTETPL